MLNSPHSLQCDFEGICCSFGCAQYLPAEDSLFGESEGFSWWANSYSEGEHFSPSTTSHTLKKIQLQQRSGAIQNVLQHILPHDRSPLESTFKQRKQLHDATWCQNLQYSSCSNFVISQTLNLWGLSCFRTCKVHCSRNLAIFQTETTMSAVDNPNYYHCYYYSYSKRYVFQPVRCFFSLQTTHFLSYINCFA